MTGIYYTDLLDVLRAAGCKVAESGTTKGWQSRARSSGGFPSAPLGVVWHHTASNTSPANDLSYMIQGSPDAPIGNLLLDRTGTYWPIAAGAANTQGKGGPFTLSRGTVPVDNGNTRLFAIEAANSGVGQAWPVEQIDAYFAGSNALNARFGNLPTDLLGHIDWTTRKIDPATAAAVQGPWTPASTNSSGSWRRSDIQAEATRRAGTAPTPPDPIPPTPGGDPVIRLLSSQTDPPEFAALFYAECDSQGRSIEVQWSGDGNDPAVRARIDTMAGAFGDGPGVYGSWPVLLVGLKNNRLHPKHTVADMNAAGDMFGHVWTDSDFAP